MNQRAAITMAMALGFLVLVGTGVLLFALAHSNRIAAIHTMFAVVVLGGIALHVRNNVRSLVKHASRRSELMLAIVPTAVVLGGTLFELPGFTRLYDWGNEWRSQQTNTREETERYQFVTTKRGAGGTVIELDIKKGRAFQYPLFAVWIEAEGVRETLYVSQSVPTNTFSGEPIERPEALPVWLHRREPNIDAVTAATPVHSWRLSTSTAAPGKATIYFEVNQSFDWNDHYAKDRFPDDAIYSGSGQVGQPSVVYAATVDLSRHGVYTALNPIGHGHHAGRDGTLDPELGKLSTALEIVDGVMVKVTAPKTASR